MEEHLWLWYGGIDLDMEIGSIWGNKWPYSSCLMAFTDFHICSHWYRLRPCSCYALPDNIVVLALQLDLLRVTAFVSVAINLAKVKDDWKILSMRRHRTGITHWKYHLLSVLMVSLFAGLVGINSRGTSSWYEIIIGGNWARKVIKISDQ